MVPMRIPALIFGVDIQATGARPARKPSLRGRTQARVRQPTGAKMISRMKRLGGMVGLLGAATLAVVGGSPGLAAARVGPSQASASAKSQDELIPLYDNANPRDWTQACSTVNGS